MTKRSRSLFAPSIVGGLLLTGCSGSSNVIPLPSFDPAGIAEKSIELYDKDGDGFLNEDELEAAPGLKSAMRNLDGDQDGKVSAEEIADRVRSWETQELGLMTVSCEVYLDGEPLSDAVVTFEPEEVMGGAIKTAVGVSGMTGTFRPKVPKEDRPTPDSPPGIQAGLYRVRISKQRSGKELLPARYNAETTLGQQISKDDYAILNKQVIFRLKSK